MDFNIFKDDLVKSELYSCSSVPGIISPSFIDALMSQYNTISTNLLDKHVPVAEMTVHHHNNIDHSSTKNLRCLAKICRLRCLGKMCRLNGIFQCCRTMVLCDAWKSALRQARRTSCFKSSAYWKSKISAVMSDECTTWKSVNMLLGEVKSSATADFSGQEYLNFIEKKVDDIHEDTSSSVLPEFTNCEHFKLASFETVCVDYIRIYILRLLQANVVCLIWDQLQYLAYQTMQ